MVKTEDIASCQQVQNDIINELEQHGCSNRDVFGCRLALEETLVERLREKAAGNEPVTIEIGLRGSGDKLQLIIAGQLRYET